MVDASPKGQFRRFMIDHLGTYFQEKGYDAVPSKPHELAGDDALRRNVVDSRLVALAVSSHRDIHLGTSSQALALNLMGPLIVEKRWDVLAALLERAGLGEAGVVLRVDFELADRAVFSESRGGATQVDLAFTTTRFPVFSEFKFAEDEFGGCSTHSKCSCAKTNPVANPMVCYLTTEAKRTYWERMAEFGLLTDRLRQQIMCPFTEFYQAYRVLMFALAKGGDFLLMYDARNICLLAPAANPPSGLWPRFLELLPPEARSRCHALAHQDALAVISDMVDEPWVAEGWLKYFAEAR